MAPSQEFLIVSCLDSDLVLDVKGESTESEAKVIVWTVHRGKNQRWRLKGNSIENVNSGLVLDICGGASKNHRLIQYPHHGETNQRFTFELDGTIRIGDTDLVLDIKGGSAKEGNSVIAWPHHGEKNQQWRLIPLV
jgi:ribosomal protein S6E (S10)